MADNPLLALYRDAALVWLDLLENHQAAHVDYLQKLQAAYLDHVRTCLGQSPSSPIGTPVTGPGVTTPTLTFSIDQLCESADPVSLWVESPSRASGYVATALSDAKSGRVIPAAHVAFTLRAASSQTLFVALVDLQALLAADGDDPLPPGIYSGQILDGKVQVATIQVELATIPC